MYFTLLKVQKFFEAVYQSLISFLRVLLRFHFRFGFKRSARDGSSVFVLANGPSLRKELDRFGKELSACSTMGVNMFMLSDDFRIIRPRYYIIVDVVILNEDTLERIKESREQMIKALKENLSWEMELFLPYEGRNSYFHRKLVSENLPLSFTFFNRTSIEGLKSLRHCMYSRGWGMPPPQNVLIGAIMASVHCGFRRIFILGADHSWHEDILIEENGEMMINDRHFYNPGGRKLPKHHGESLKQFKIHEYFNELSRTFRSHIMVEEYARSKGIEILNASSVSYIDAYKRIKPESIPWDQVRDR